MDNLDKEQVIQICEAYEDGQMAGRMNLSADNNIHTRESKEFYAWIVGHNMGIQMEFIEYEEGYIN